MRIHQRQGHAAGTVSHAQNPFTALAHVERRGVDDGQQLGPGFLGGARRGLEPGVFTDQQANLHALHRKHAHATPRREVAALVKHLVVRQLAFDVLGHQLAFAEHAGGVKPTLHRHRFGAVVPALGVAHHHVQAF